MGYRFLAPLLLSVVVTAAEPHSWRGDGAGDSSAVFVSVVTWFFRQRPWVAYLRPT